MDEPAAFTLLGPDDPEPVEVLRPGGADLAAPGARALNPAFDVTPAGLINAIVTEQGVLRAPYGRSIAAAVPAASPIGVEAVP